MSAIELISLSAIVQAMSRIMTPAEIRTGCRRGFVAYMRVFIGRDMPYTTAIIGRQRDYLFSPDAAVFILDHCTPSFALLALKKQIFTDQLIADDGVDDMMADMIKYIIHGAGSSAVLTSTTEADVVAAATAVFNVTSALVPERLRQVTKYAASAALAHLAGSEA